MNNFEMAGSKRLFVVVLAAFALLAPLSAMARDAKAGLVEQAIGAARLKMTIDQLMSDSVQRLSASPQVSQATPEQQEALAELYRGIFVGEHVVARLRERLLADAGPAELRAFTSAFMTPLALRMQALEDAASKRQDSSEAESLASTLRRRLAGRDRVALVGRIDDAVQASDMLSVIAVAPSLADADLSEPSESPTPPADRAAALNQALQQSRRLRPEIREQVIANLLYTYKDVSRRDLQAYVDLHEKPAVRAVLRLITQAIGACVIEMQRDAIELTVRELQGKGLLRS
jgi:hypothetical protein